MRLYSIEMTDLAETDLEDAGDYIAFELHSPDAAVNTVEGIRNTINNLANNPYKNALDDDPKLAELGVRMDYYHNYKIYYVVDADSGKIYIVRVLHMRVDSRVWLYRTFRLTI